MMNAPTCRWCGAERADHGSWHPFAATPKQSEAPCECRGYDAADPCRHGDTSQGCPRHDADAFAEWLFAECDA